jgi:hypothetical protein
LIFGTPARCVSGSFLDLGSLSRSLFLDLHDRGVGEILFGVRGVILIALAPGWAAAKSTPIPTLMIKPNNPASALARQYLRRMLRPSASHAQVEVSMQ